MKNPLLAKVANVIAALISITLLILIVCSAAMAQGGGKAEPNRIEFKRGTTSTTISGAVRGNEEAEYVLAAKKGQTLTIKITSVPGAYCRVRFTWPRRRGPGPGVRHQHKFFPQAAQDRRLFDYRREA